MYSKAGKRGQLLSKWGTVWRWVEEVLWRTSLEDFEISLTLEKLNETSSDKKDVKDRDTRKSRRRHNDCCDLSTVNRFRRTCWDERKWSTIWWGLLRVTAQVLLWALDLQPGYGSRYKRIGDKGALDTCACLSERKGR